MDAHANSSRIIKNVQSGPAASLAVENHLLSRMPANIETVRRIITDARAILISQLKDYASSSMIRGMRVRTLLIRTIRSLRLGFRVQ
jgi:hypothetical protein